MLSSRSRWSGREALLLALAVLTAATYVLTGLGSASASAADASETGSISVTKVLDDPQQLADPDVVYTGSWWYCSTGSPAGGGTWSTRANETWTFSPVLAGYDVCIDEDRSAGNAVPGGALWEYTVTVPGDVSTIVSGQSTDFTVSNWYRPLPEQPQEQYGFFEVAKQVVDPGGLSNPDAVYTGTYSFPDGVDLGTGSPYSGQSGGWSVSAGATSPLFLVPAGATVTIAEDAPASVAGASWSSDLPDPVEIASWTTSRLTVTNTLSADETPVDPEPATGTFAIVQRVADPLGLADPQHVYGGSYSYPAGMGHPAGSGRWSAVAGATWTSGPVPVGAVVTVTEDVIDSISGATWTTTITGPVTVTASGDSEVIVTSSLSVRAPGAAGPESPTAPGTQARSATPAPSAVLATTGATATIPVGIVAVAATIAGIILLRRRAIPGE